MITKVQLDAAVSKMESKLDSRLNAKTEALKESFNSQIKALENKSSLDGLGVISKERIDISRQAKLEEKIELLEARVLSLESLLKNVISPEE